jgi:acyl carrier protein phosphodiesterase
MNYLSHLYLSGTDPEILVGNFMGDHVKGRLVGQYPARIMDGVMLHRRIDSFADSDPFFQQSRSRLSPGYGLYRGVLVDLFYDHFLAVEWQDWSGEALSDYLERVRLVVADYSRVLPERLQQLFPQILTELLPSYLEVAGIASALERMSRRVKRANPLAGGEQELLRLYDALRDDFHHFLPAASVFAAACLEHPFVKPEK